VTFPVLFVCICVLHNCHRVATQLQLNISYQTSISYKSHENSIISKHNPKWSFQTTPTFRSVRRTHILQITNYASYYGTDVIFTLICASAAIISTDNPSVGPFLYVSANTHSISRCYIMSTSWVWKVLSRWKLSAKCSTAMPTKSLVHISLLRKVPSGLSSVIIKMKRNRSLNTTTLVVFRPINENEAESQSEHNNISCVQTDKWKWSGIAVWTQHLVVFRPINGNEAESQSEHNNI
jgi:hypothetical protein